MTVLPVPMINRAPVKAVNPGVGPTGSGSGAAQLATVKDSATRTLNRMWALNDDTSSRSAAPTGSRPSATQNP